MADNVIANNTVAEDECISIWNGDGEVVVNNILVAKGEVFSFNNATRNVLVDYNLCRPKSDRQGPHGIASDPMFVDAGKGVFWLQEGSPAIGIGSSQYAPAKDFWGRSRPKDQPQNLGAFPFVSVLATEGVREHWDYGWAYHRHGSGGMMPDFWSLKIED